VTPFFSIILPTYNRAHHLAKAVESVVAQTFTDWELIVVDDASTDNTEELVHLFAEKDARIRCLKNQINQERCISRNRGIEEASGKYICFLDSDDYHLPAHLHKLYDFIQEKGEPEAFFFSNAWDESAAGIRTERHCPDFEITDPYTYFLRYTVNPQRWAAHRNVMRTHLFDPAVTICEDMDTSLRMVAAGVKVYQFKERTTVYVAAPDSFTHGASDKWERELSNLKKIFARPDLKGKISRTEINRLRSMCHYHLAVKAFKEGRNGTVWIEGLRSFLLYSPGYNGRTNKPLAVILLYSLYLLGDIIRWVVNRMKK
jgi:glycosyltransferase involved in cell wall biosynthesis